MNTTGQSGKPAVLLDMDGVLVDFVGGLHRALDLPYDPNNYPYTPGNYDMFDEIVRVHGNKIKSVGQIYRATDERAFWANLEWTEYGKQILDVVNRFRVPVYLCTKPMQRPEAWAGKVDWIRKNIKAAVEGTIIMSAPKHLLAKPEHILIDDKDENIDKFYEAGGRALLIPQPWNSGSSVAGANIMSDLHMCLEIILRSH